MRFESTPVALCALAVAVCFTAGCGDLAERRQLERVLAERAAHLSAEDRARIVRGAQRASRRFEIDALMLLAVAEEESRFRPTARSRRGALGLMQVRPETARNVARRHAIEWSGPDQLYDPEFGLIVGAAYLSELRERFDSWELALTAYHQGPTRTRSLMARGRDPLSGYSARVQRRREQLLELVD